MESISQLPQLQNAEYLVYVTNKENEQLIFAIVNFQTGKTVLRILGPSGDFENCMNEFSTRFDKNCKALILNIFEYKSDDCNVKLYNAFKEKVDSLKIPYYFISSNDFVYTILLIFANITVNYDETITAICVTKAEYIITEFKFTNSGYEQIRQEVIQLNTKDDPKLHREKIMGQNNTKNLIFGPSLNTRNRKFLTLKVLKSTNVSIIFVNNDAMEDITKFTIEVSKWLIDKSNIKYHIIPTFSRSISLLFNHFMAEKGDLLPINNSRIFTRVKTYYYKTCDDLQKKGITTFTSKNPTKIYHRLKHIFEVDINNFVNALMEPIILPQIQSLPEILNKSEKSDIHVIAFCDNFSVICIYKEEGYTFANNWKGFLGNELFISFKNKKPLFFEKALEPVKSFENEEEIPAIVSNCIVYDLIKILSLSINEIKVEDNWKFEFTSDSKNPILLQFDDREDEGKLLSPPTLLMALLLKEHKKAIVAETGKKPDKFGFCILDESYSNEEKERIKKGLEESCNLLKIGYNYIEI